MLYPNFGGVMMTIAIKCTGMPGENYVTQRRKEVWVFEISILLT
jgi:hypothetical protein